LFSCVCVIYEIEKPSVVRKCVHSMCVRFAQCDHSRVCASANMSPFTGFLSVCSVCMLFCVCSVCACAFCLVVSCVLFYFCCFCLRVALFVIAFCELFCVFPRVFLSMNARCLRAIHTEVSFYSTAFWTTLIYPVFVSNVRVFLFVVAMVVWGV